MPHPRARLRRRISEAEQRVAERWQAADQAPRLLAEIPDLRSLRMAIQESSSGTFASVAKHTRLFVLDTAPAMFFVPCGDPRCEQGGHDLTLEVMSGLREGKETFSGEDACHGTVGSSPCSAAIRFTITATYDKP